jgi:pimeloyl-ACP methyl ester carboxylesterase
VEPVKLEPRLIATRVPADPEAAVLVLHGGASRSGNMMVSPTQLSVLRMIPIAARLAHSGGRRLAVYRLLNSRRGWDTKHTPVDDVRWALGQLRERFGRTLAVGLVGHSLGGRAAILAATQPEVRSVVALAPWVYPNDGDRDLSGRQVLFVHGAQDRIARPANSAAAARALSRTADVGYITILGGKHAMLRHHSQFDGLAAQFAVATLLGVPATGPVRQVLDGEQWLEV